MQGVASDKGALGYFGLAYYLENKDKLKLVGVDNGTGPIFPSDSTVKSGKYAPLSRPEFIYVNANSAKNEVVKQFIKFYIDHAAQLVQEVGYVPLPAAVYMAAYNRMLQSKQGSMFEKTSTVGADLEKLMNANQ